MSYYGVGPSGDALMIQGTVLVCVVALLYVIANIIKLIVIGGPPRVVGGAADATRSVKKAIACAKEEEEEEEEPEYADEYSSEEEKEKKSSGISLGTAYMIAKSKSPLTSAILCGIDRDFGNIHMLLQSDSPFQDYLVSSMLDG